MIGLPDGWALLTVALGPVAGSFIAAASIRMPAGRPIAWDRSACDHCHRVLAPAELAPLASYVMLRGRCRSCRGPIAPRHALLEAAGLALGVWAAAAAPGPTALVGAFLAWQLLLLAVLDAEHFWLPRPLTLTLIASGLAAAAVHGADRLLSSAIGAAAGYAALRLVGAAYRRLRGREGLGGGDAYLLAGAGAWLGWAALPSVLVWASLAGIAAMLGLRLAGREVTSGTAAPFGLFLAPAIWIVWLYGPIGG